MRVMTCYIVNDILKSALIALLLLLMLFNLFTLTDELKNLGKGSYDLADIFAFLALTSPGVCYELVPSSALLGALFALGEMGNQRELIAMRAAGMSIWAIIRAVLMAGVVLMFIAVVVGEFIAPLTESQAQLLKATAINQRVVLHARYGLWLRENDTFINVRKIEENGDLANVNIYTVANKTHLQSVKHAEKAIYFKDQQWKLKNVAQSDISLDKIKANVVSVQTWQSSIAPDLVKMAVVIPDNLSLVDLFHYIHFLQNNQQKSRSFELAFWGRIVNPFVTFVMLMVATPFVIGIKRGINVGGRIMIGIVIGLSFNILDQIAGHVGLIYDLNPFVVAVTPSVLLCFASVYALKKMVF